MVTRVCYLCVDIEQVPKDLYNILFIRILVGRIECEISRKYTFAIFVPFVHFDLLSCRIENLYNFYIVFRGDDAALLNKRLIISCCRANLLRWGSVFQIIYSSFWKVSSLILLL